MTLKKVNKMKGFILVDKIDRLLLYQRFLYLFLKKRISESMKNFLWVI